jgi:hypothetical protein
VIFSSLPPSLSLPEVYTLYLSAFLGSLRLFKYAKAIDIAQCVRNAEESSLMDELLNLVRFPSGVYADDIDIVVYFDG